MKPSEHKIIGAALLAASLFVVIGWAVGLVWGEILKELDDL